MARITQITLTSAKSVRSSMRDPESTHGTTPVAVAWPPGHRVFPRLRDRPDRRLGAGGARGRPADLPGHRPLLRGARRGPGLAYDARREGGATPHQQRTGHPPAGRPAV